MIRKGLQIVTLTVLFCVCATAQDGRFGKVTGAIYDYNGALILGTEVTISNDKVQKTTYPDVQTGIFLFEVPPGVYSLTTEQNWWFPIRRAKFLVSEGKTVAVNLQPSLRIASIASVITTNGFKDVAERNSLPNLVELQPFSDSPLNVVIEYEKSKQKAAATKYTYAQLTYNDLSIRANVLTFDTKTLSIKASGNVTIDKGGSRQKKGNLAEQLVQVK